MKHLIMILVFIFLLFSCKKQENNKDVVLIKYNDTEKVNFSDLFDECAFIFPESKDPAWFGLQIRKMEMIQEKMFLYNLTSTGSNILCFDTKGKFLFDINRFGQGPGEYTLLNDFMIDKKHNILILDVTGNQYGRNEYIYLDLNGNYLYSKSRQDIEGFPSSMIEYNDSLYIVNVYCALRDNCNDIIFFDKEGLDVIKSFNCVDKYANENTPSQSFCKTSDSFLFYGGNDTIYTISIEADNPLPAYFVDFGSQQQQYFKNIVGKTHEEILALSRKMFTNKEKRSVRHIFSNDKYLAVHYRENKNIDTKYDLCSQTLFYDKEKKKTYNTNNMEFDIFNFVKNDKMEIIGCFDGYFYSILNSPFTRDEINKIAKSKFLSEEDKHSFLNLDEDSNPVIFIFK